MPLCGRFRTSTFGVRWAVGVRSWSVVRSGATVRAHELDPSKRWLASAVWHLAGDSLRCVASHRLAKPRGLWNNLAAVRATAACTREPMRMSLFRHVSGCMALVIAAWVAVCPHAGAGNAPVRSLRPASGRYLLASSGERADSPRRHASSCLVAAAARWAGGECPRLGKLHWLARWFTEGAAEFAAAGCAASACVPGQEPDASGHAPLERGLVAHWPLAGDARELVHDRLTRVRGEVDFQSDHASAFFGGSESALEVPADQAPTLGASDFSLAMWLKSDEDAEALPGDLISRYDVRPRRGFLLTLKSNLGVTTSQANWRHIQFGIDDGRQGAWRDCGRPGHAVLAFALAVHEGALYAGTCEPGKEERGRVYRYAGGQEWIDCGAPDGSNSVMALAVYRGRLYAGTGKYRLAGSSLPESENATLGGRIFRYEGGNRWTDCGQLHNTEAVGGLVVFKGQLYASSLYKPAGFFRYEGETGWTALPVPQAAERDAPEPQPRRVVALTVHDGFIYASSYDGGHVYRFDGDTWTDCGQLADNTQTYSFVRYGGRLLVGTWPSGRVYRFEESGRWTDLGRLGEELEVMGMLVHNGRLLAGTLPLAEVYSYEGDAAWKRLAQLDATAGVKYRRAWTMAEHDGHVYCSTLPSGRVFAFAAGAQAGWGYSLSSEWHHIAAVKSADRLVLFVDGEQVAQTPRFDAAGYQLDSRAPLLVGAGPNGTLNGRLSDVRLYGRALTRDEVETLARMRPR